MELGFRSMLLMVVATLLLSGVVAPPPGDPCNLNNSDGCSIPGGGDFPFKDTFTPACFRHDVCYHCGVDYSVNRAECDLAFRDDMRDICSGISNYFVRRSCLYWANVYYFGVVVGGAPAYQDPSLAYCAGNAGVPPCLPP